MRLDHLLLRKQLRAADLVDEGCENNWEIKDRQGNRLLLFNRLYKEQCLLTALFLRIFNIQKSKLCAICINATLYCKFVVNNGMRQIILKNEFIILILIMFLYLFIINIQKYFSFLTT